MEELKAAVSSALESRGVLSRIKAELRASVFLAVDEHGAPQGEGLADGSHERAREFHATPEGAAVAALVADYLRWCGYTFTLQVLEPESTLGADVIEMPREELARKAGVAVADDEEVPVLARLLRTRADSPAAVLATAATSLREKRDLLSDEREDKIATDSRRTRPDSAFGSSKAPVVLQAAEAELQATDIRPTTETMDSAENTSATEAAEVLKESEAAEVPEAAESASQSVAAPLSKLAPVSALGGIGGRLAPLAPLRPVGGSLAPLRPVGGELAPLKGAPRASFDMPSSLSDSGEGLPAARPASAFASEFLGGSQVDDEDEEGVDEEVDELAEEVDEEEIVEDDLSLQDEFEDISTQSFDASHAHGAASAASGVFASDKSGEIDGAYVDLLESAEVGM